MDNNSYLNFIVFIITTILYFLIKPDPDIKKEDGTESQSGSNYMMTGAYFLVVIISQFFINSYIITSSCGGNVMSNLKESALYTFVPWTLIFGVVMIALVAYPDIKSAFSDVYGYYFVAGSARAKLKTNLPVILHHADHMASIIEYERWRNGKITAPATEKSKIQKSNALKNLSENNPDVATAISGIFSAFNVE